MGGGRENHVVGDHGRSVSYARITLGDGRWTVPSFQAGSDPARPALAITSCHPHRHRLNVLISRTNHLAYHRGQLVLVQSK
jgi:hypothetical protein